MIRIIETENGVFATSAPETVDIYDMQENEHENEQRQLLQ